CNLFGYWRIRSTGNCNGRAINDIEKIVSVFNFLKDLFEKIGNEQSGGMSLANFDNELSEIFSKLNVRYENYKDIFSAIIRDLIIWCNDNHTRMGQTSYYITFNIGLAKDDFGKFLAETLIDEFYKLGDLVYKPNIVFKVKSGINLEENTKNFSIFKKALLCSAKKMIPTYLLCDSKTNSKYNPLFLSVVGCRTRVVENIYGESTSVGRGNIANISINLPRLAFEIKKEIKFNSENNNNFFELLKKKWLYVAENCKDILLDRFNKICNSDVNLFPTNKSINLWIKPFDNLYDVFKNGTLSIGFIGLSECFEILTGKKFWKDSETYFEALKFVSFMRKVLDSYKNTTKLNFSLLATSGELISGRFLEIDKNIYPEYEFIFSKGYYTNSFHVDVDSHIAAYKKIKLEGPFHYLSNGGCITYIELKEAPIGNYLGLIDLIKIAIESGTHYMGINFHKDFCSDCENSGIFTNCSSCGSENIIRIRRVSGYLEIENYFTKGKMNESKNRKGN
ncbi:MAG: hypothetical protein K2K18_00715, partial [Malacoplasma sp.]|nr:hypothetical protein [Malacoplasma sp.]